MTRLLEQATAKKHPKRKLLWAANLTLSFLTVASRYIKSEIRGSVPVYLFLFGIACGLVLAIFIVLGLLRALNYKSWKTALPSLVGILAIGTVVFSPIERIREALKAERILEGRCEHTVSMAWIVLRNDHSFEYAPATFLEPKLYEGTFSRKGDSIVLYFEDSIPQAHTKMVFKKSERGQTYLSGYDAVENVYHDFYLDVNTFE